GRLQVPHPPEQVVPGDVRNGWPKPEPGADLAHLLREAGRVEPAGVDYDLDPPVQARAQDLFQLHQEGLRVAGAGVLLPRLPQDHAWSVRPARPGPAPRPPPLGPPAAPRAAGRRKSPSSSRSGPAASRRRRRRGRPPCPPPSAAPPHRRAFFAERGGPFL